VIFVIHLNYNRQGFQNCREDKHMAATALVQTRIDPALKDRAAEVLDSMGLTVSDAVRILLTRIAREGALPFDFAVDPAAHDAWFRAKVREALDDLRPAEGRMAQRRAAALRKAGAK
jgi:DNA-damage-inducible protein J